MTSARRLLWSAGAPVRVALIGAIALYRLTLSGWLGGQCRFSPTCSRYAEEAVRSHGAIRGSLLAAGRVLRCNPFGRGGLDPVPAARQVYDDAIRCAPRGVDPTAELARADRTGADRPGAVSSGRALSGTDVSRGVLSPGIGRRHAG